MQKRKCEKCGEEFENLEGSKCPDCGGNLSKSSTGRDWTTMYVHKGLLDRLKKLLMYGDTPESFLKRAVEREEMKKLSDKHKLGTKTDVSQIH